ncbi:TIGR03619 family F420-dependent LLM class oxidoreductase [Actinocrinis puniceicyclus]|uniref:TIGR03619 family F420-dependent LLM class oxidoreductase n=1 Tax=Actinocrinis puniceicyclus TaxID=977794 RepID=A0A8J7WQM2_9ACTN|nr:TIGR03619 family F420-dependent LLM class oxidoreductase [Actinocrinis puniceicyclus]MBS2966716.1 TIGR03619 family F420-dependent LLM class oxidoreductase [Actinocrinis puniceicyclus]
MKIGFGAPVSGAWAGPENLALFAQRAEELGYASLWTFQRLLIPGDGHADPPYRSVLDPLLALAYAAARTSRIRLGVALVNMPFVAPAYLAKQAATLDVLSAGRLDLGLGVGWSPLEFTATGAPSDRRGARAEEYLSVLRALWGPGAASFNGRFYTLPECQMHPKPVQQPGPPILLGAVVPAALRRAGRLADGWISRSATDLENIGESIALVRESARDAGRDPDALRVVVRGVVRPDPSGAGTAGPGGRRLPLSGSFAQIRADTQALADAGVSELYYDLNWDPQVTDPADGTEVGVRRATRILEALAP